VLVLDHWEASFMTCTGPSVHRLNIPASPEETNARDHPYFVLSDRLSLSYISIFSFFSLNFYALRIMLKKQQFCGNQKWFQKKVCIQRGMHTTRMLTLWGHCIHCNSSCHAGKHIVDLLLYSCARHCTVQSRPQKYGLTCRARR
jgi:hypothetical protein